MDSTPGKRKIKRNKQKEKDERKEVCEKRLTPSVLISINI